MNLHIITDAKISETFYRNLRDLNLLENNRVVVRCNAPKLKFITENVPFAPLYSGAFNSIIGLTNQYEKIFIHQFSPLMYRWIANGDFKEVNWMVWGADLYNLSGIDFNFYEQITWRKYIRGVFSIDSILFKLKVLLTNSIYKNRAYSRVDRVLTWMKEEYDFAKRHLPALRAEHTFFFYENRLPYSQLDNLLKAPNENFGSVQRLIIGNSGTPSNNHLDAIQRLEENNVKADLLIPISYGERDYIKFLKRNLPAYTGGRIELIEQFMPFDEYVNFCASSDGLIMNNIRPQGYGNVLMMLYLGKRVFFNEKNISLPDLARYGIAITPWDDLKSPLNREHKQLNREGISKLFSHVKLEALYLDLFSADRAGKK